MHIEIEIKEYVRAKDCQWTIRTVRIRNFNRPIKVEYVWRKGGREIEYVRKDVVKQVGNWLRDGTPVTGASDWHLRAVWTAIL